MLSTGTKGLLFSGQKFTGTNGVGWKAYSLVVQAGKARWADIMDMGLEQPYPQCIVLVMC